MIEKLYEITKTNKFMGHKLTKALIKLSSFSCMTVIFAAQVFRNSLAKCIEENANDLENYDTREIVKFIRLMNRFLVNGKNSEKGEEKSLNPDKAQGPLQ